MSEDREETNRTVSNRRTFLAATAVGSAALAGCLGSDDDNGDDDAESENGDGESESAELHERYGYPSTSMDDEPPVEPDHEVNLRMDADGDDVVFYFEPAGLAIESSDVVQFNFETPDHSVAAFHEAFGRGHRTPEDSEPLSSPMMAVGTYWLASFETEGVWDLYCPPHEMLGMGMRIVVDEATGPGTEPAAEMEYEPGESLPPQEPLAATFDNEALDPETILEEGSVSWHDLE